VRRRERDVWFLRGHLEEGDFLKNLASMGIILDTVSSVSGLGGCELY